MTHLEIFSSPLGPLMARYVAFKRALGRSADSIARILRYLDRFLLSSHVADLTPEAFNTWSESMAALRARTRHTRLRTVYHFCLFRRRDDPHSFVPDPTQFPPQGPRPMPYIYSEADVVRLLAGVENLAPHHASPLHREVARVAIVVLYTTGLRRGELVRLTLNDCETTDQVLHVRRSKFDKSRLVPLSADAAAELDRYLTARRKLGVPCNGDTPLLVNHHGARFRGYTGAGLCRLLRKVIQLAGIRTLQNRIPRLHDFRFTFAAQALLRWYRAGVDVQARLPALSTYLGHTSVVSTQYYLTFLEATAAAASERFHAHSQACLPPRVLEGGHQ